MSFFPSLNEGATLDQVQAPFKEMYRHWGRFSDALMRGPGPLTVAERELIAAYTSGLNACSMCYHDHTMAATEFGVDPGTYKAVLADIDTAPVEAKMKPLLRYARKLTQTPAQLTAADAQAVFDAGWSEGALHIAIMVCARFNCINRLVMGHGLQYTPAYGDVWRDHHGLSYLIPEER